MGLCLSSENAGYSVQVKAKKSFLKEKQVQISATNSKAEKATKTVEFLKNENQFLREQIAEAQRDMWHEEKSRMTSEKVILP